ncbi:hypothetical protein [Lentzea sp. CA-135723]|uniref:hypothetical protein n=1 Tax=Lentzea sp. CA-135723 TaxID=3239950 RepID=UPI003D8A406B
MDEGCRRPPGYQPRTLQRLNGGVLEAGGTPGELFVCVVHDAGNVTSSLVSGPPGGDFGAQVGLFDDSGTSRSGGSRRTSPCWS